MSSLVNHTVDGDNVLAASAADTASNGEQKRPNSNDAECEPEGKKRRVAEADEDAKPPAAERCYICFDLRDGDGDLPVRDCSCRGGAGFAHKSCIVQYAKMNHEDRGRGFIELWERCPLCKQKYQNNLALDLANEVVAFVEGRVSTAYSREWHLCEQLAALSHQLSVIDYDDPLEEGLVRVATLAANKVFSVIDEVKKLADASLYEGVTTAAEASAYLALGFVSLDGDSTPTETALGYFEKCREIFEGMGEEGAAALFEAAIDAAKLELEGKSSHSIDEKQAKSCERLYEEMKKEKGEGAAAQLLSVQSGLNNWASSSAASIGTTQRSPDGRLVTNMPYTDEYNDTGLYSGETNDYGVPHGRGRMKYDQDGETLEGKWVNGVWCGPDAAQRLSSGLSAFQGGAPQARKGSVASKQSARA